MHKSLLLIVVLLFQSAWSIEITGTKEIQNKWNLKFSYIPVIEKIGAFKTTIRLSGGANISSISTDAPNSGAWSQVKPELQRIGNLVEVLCVGPVMMNSQLTDTLEMFHISFEISGESEFSSPFNGIIDSIWFSECLNIQGSEIIPRTNLQTVSLQQFKKASDRSKSVQYRSIGRIHSLTFNLAGTEMVKAWVVDIRGKVITKLTQQTLKPGMHTLRWPENNRQIATGTYFIQLEINNFTYNKKVNYYR